MSSPLIGAPKIAQTLGKPGVWGQLESYPAVLEPPSSLLLEPEYLTPEFGWTFPKGWTEEQILKFFEESGVSSEEAAALLLRGSILNSEDSTFFVPPVEQVRNFTPETRRTLYGSLGQWPTNSFEATPFALGARRVSEIAALAPHSFPPELITMADNLVYQDDSTFLRFSDYSLICQQLPDSDSRIDFAKLLLRTPTLIVRVHLAPHLGQQSLRQYWSSNGMNSTALPILDSYIDSIKDDESPAPLDLVYLLPPVPKKLLFTFSPIDLGVAGSYPDCFWTALNFFLTEPNQRYFDPVLKSVVNSDWRQVPPPYQFGDLIILHQPDGVEARHACNYIADDIVFTKNGRSTYFPWVLQRLDEVRAQYGAANENQMKVFRHRKNFAPEDQSNPR
ncbi:MAG: hypothetical protein KDN20_16600 [Verrucomicrobiae bacterium]|nr:hypothetical protein [Verrucomicrobiae bacterium]